MSKPAFKDLPESSQSDLIDTGLSFIRAVTDAYGSDTGMQLWDTIASTLDPEIKGQTFFSMLTGANLNNLTLASSTSKSRGQYVEFIKNVRIATGIGLKEAKDICDLVEAGRPQKITLINPVDRNSVKRNLVNMGVKII
jgi:hypothetical protein